MIDGDAHPGNFAAILDPASTELAKERRPGRKCSSWRDDFDELHSAPFEWELVRAAAGLSLAADAVKLSAGDKQKIVAKLLDGYRAALQENPESGGGWPNDISKKKKMSGVVAGLAKKAEKATEADLLDGYVKNGTFVTSNKLKAVDDAYEESHRRRVELGDTEVHGERHRRARGRRRCQLGHAPLLYPRRRSERKW